MKFHNLLTALALFVIALSCEKQNDPKKGEGTGLDIIEAAAEPAATTRLSLAADGSIPGYKLVWSSSDAITVVGKDDSGCSKSSRFTLTSGGGTPNATFAGSLNDCGNAPYLAVFPSRDDVSIEDGFLKFGVSQNKGAQSNNIAASTLPAVAAVEINNGSPKVILRNMMGLLKVSITSQTSVQIKQIDLHDLGGNILWGECEIPVNADGTPDYDAAVFKNGDNTIKMRWNTSVTFNKTAKAYFFPVPVGSLDRGFSLVFHTYDLSQADSLGRTYTVIQKISSPVPAQRSSVIEMDTFNITEKSEALEENARGFYKDIFLDGGAYLTSNYKSSQIPATSYINLETEGFGSGSSASEIETEKGIFVTSPQGNVTWEDANGVLVYPDGEPRFRTLYVNGGTSYNHGPTLGDEGRTRIHDYFYAGGSYTGSCAGSFLSSTYIDGTKRYGNATASNNWSFGLFPGNLNHTGLPRNINTYPTVYTGMKILPALKALPYYPKTFQQKDTIEDTRHHGGSYYPHDSRNSGYKIEELLSFQYSDHSIVKDTSQFKPSNFGMEKFKKSNGTNPKIVDSVCTWAYKPNSLTGRMVVTGSHPEAQKTGSQRDYMAMMFLYAMDGVGEPPVKRNLTLGYLCRMNKSTEDKVPNSTKIGDRQYHHFKFTPAEDLKDVQVTLDSEYDAASGVDLYLCMRRNGFAWMTDADFSVCTKGGKKTLNIKNLPAGEWYISVYCATTVSATLTTSSPYYYVYSGNTDVLDGVAYSIKVDKNVPYSASATKAGKVSNSFDE